MDHLLVPIKVQALVIDDLAIKRKGAIVESGAYYANAGRWSRAAQDYRKLTDLLGAPGPKPFFGASRNYEGKSTAQLIVPQSALPNDDDRGVYLHWVLPAGLRHSYKPNTFDFPALPDQWLIVRFFRRDGESQKTKAWFLDSTLLDDPDAETNLLFAVGKKYEAKNVGKVVALEDFTPAKFQGDHKTINAIGNAETGSPTFTASLAENQNILSFHDSLNDLRAPADTGTVPKGTVLTYLLLGWYLNDQNEPLTAIREQLTSKSPVDVLNALGWRTASESLPPDLLNRRCLFHGMVAHVNYWASSYKGPMLGYPGSPPVEDVASIPPPSFKVGVGNNAEDALVSLVSSGFAGAADKPNLWKALEAVIYRQPESLVGSWNTAPRDHTVHQSWFSTVEAGKLWSIRPKPGDKSVFPTDAEATAKETNVKPTPEQLAALQQINKLQLEADATARELAALQQDLYARWWKLTAKSTDENANLEEETEACRALATRITTLRQKRDGLLDQLRPLPKQLADKLPKELELSSDSAPRFWAPADPVIVVRNCGETSKHQFPKAPWRPPDQITNDGETSKLPCRLPDQITTSIEVVVNKQPKPFNTVAGLTHITAAMNHFAPRTGILTSLLNEASLIEQAITDLAQRTLPANMFSANIWEDWVARINKDLTSDGKPESSDDQIQFRSSGGSAIPPHHLVDLWERQPWAPLFLDWQITWFPATPALVQRKDGKDFGPVWPLADHDYEPLNLDSLQPVITAKGTTIRGRSLLSPIDGRIFKQPIETLRELIKPAEKDQKDPAFPEVVAKALRNYQIIWDKTLAELETSGLMGQALTGFHQALLNRDVTLARIIPSANQPWIKEASLESLESEVMRLLSTPDDATLGVERLSPPADPDATPVSPFSSIRAGAFRIDELWLVDDFGQWADLLGPTPSRSASSGQVFHPRVRWHDNPDFIAMPPRVVQPARLNFRFTSADNPQLEADSDPALSPICGWIFYNPLDQSLVLCERSGRLAGELVITRADEKNWRVNWRSVTTGGTLSDVRNPSLRGFAQALEETSPNPKLLDLLALIEHALQRIRPAAARRDAVLFGRPLALVSATLGLELFGKAWTNPLQKNALTARPAGTGDPMLDELSVPINLGCSLNTEDGLIGYFKNGDYNQLLAPHCAATISGLRSSYVSQQKSDGVSVGFKGAAQLTLLMDPWGSVQAACGVVPSKTITLAQAELDQTVKQLETSFRVGPVLLQTDKLALPTPVGDKGQWHFSGPLTSDAASAIAPFDPKYFSDTPVVATEGRMVLLTPKE